MGSSWASPRSDARSSVGSLGVIDDLAGGLDAAGRARVEELRKEFLVFLRELLAERRETSDENASDVISMVLSAADADKRPEKERPRLLRAAPRRRLRDDRERDCQRRARAPREPRQWDKLRREPALVKTTVEEMVRYDGAVQSFFRNVLVDTEIAGVPIPKGAKVELLFASANRDDRKFESPDRLSHDRAASDHIGYGAGIDFCLGAPLARAQLNALWKTMAERCKGFTLDGKVERTSSVLFDGARILPIRLDPGLSSPVSLSLSRHDERTNDQRSI